KAARQFPCPRSKSLERGPAPDQARAASRKSPSASRCRKISPPSSRRSRRRASARQADGCECAPQDDSRADAGRCLAHDRACRAGQIRGNADRTPSGESRTAFVDPYDGGLIGTLPEGGVMQIVRKIHSLQYFGFWASCLVEIAAGWAIVLALSG